MSKRNVQPVDQPSKPRAVFTEDFKEKLYTLVEEHLQGIHSAGFIVPACDVHGRDHVQVGDDGAEFCQECAADDASGELVHLGLDSEAIEIVDLIAKAFEKENI